MIVRIYRTKLQLELERERYVERLTGGDKHFLNWATIVPFSKDNWFIHKIQKTELDIFSLLMQSSALKTEIEDSLDFYSK